MIRQAQRSFLLGIAQILELDPDIRLGQLISFLGAIADDSDRSLYDVEDDDLIAATYRHLEMLQKRVTENIADLLPLAKSA